MTSKRRQRVPRTRAGETMTESQYFSFIRSGLRAKSQRWPPKFQLLKDERRAVKGKRHKWEYQCAHCKQWFQMKEVQIDHIVATGSLTSYEDLPRFVATLFCEVDNLQILCKPCHQVKSNEERNKSIT